MSELEEVKSQLNRIETKLDALLEKMDISVKECNKMGEHIDFIEGIYETVKFPLTYLCNKVHIFAGSDATSIEEDDNMAITN
jgi:hypothetical protein